MATYFITGRKTTSSFHIKVRGTARGRGHIFFIFFQKGEIIIVMLIAMVLTRWPVILTVIRILLIVMSGQVEGQQAEASVLPAFTCRSLMMIMIMIMLKVIIMMMIMIRMMMMILMVMIMMNMIIMPMVMNSDM